MPATSLTAFHVRLGATARTPQESIRAVGEVLVAANCIEPGYISSMLSREAQANTYLGRGIAIPHGQPQDRGLIRQTGVAVMQFPSGIEWRADQTVYVVV